jgi:hypothetical protein
LPAGDGDAEVIDGRGWARRILARHEAGYQLPRISLKFAREALGLPEPDREPAARPASDGSMIE